MANGLPEESDTFFFELYFEKKNFEYLPRKSLGRNDQESNPILESHNLVFSSFLLCRRSDPDMKKMLTTLQTPFLTSDVFNSALESVPVEDWFRTWETDRTIMLRRTSKTVKQVVDKMRLSVSILPLGK